VNPKNFLTELKRRNVYRAAVAYGVVAWFLTQLTTQVLPLFEIPNSAVRFVVIALAAGFPIAMLLSWLYELTPEGIVRTEDLHPARARSIQRATGRILDFIIIGALLLVIAMLVVGRLQFYRQTGESISQKSIAVLPFSNLSKEQENAFFADGMQDEILTDLARVGDLKVISRSSVMQYKSGVKRNLREIASELGVTHVVEGSVQRGANRVRVNAQLIDARTDRQLWGQTYDRELVDVFAIQTHLAQHIVRELQAKLSPMEKAQIERKPTENSEAYLAFLQAHDLYTRPDKFQSTIETAEELFEKATKLDPNFAGAFAGLALVEDWIYHDFDPTPARKEKARAAVETAIRLQPDLPEAHLALGFYHYYCERDYQAALDEFAIAKRDLPNAAEVYSAIGAIERRQGKWAEGIANLEKAALLSPKDAWILENLADSYYATRNFESADKTLDRAIEAAPNLLRARAQKARLAVDWKGDLSVMEKELALLPPGLDPGGFLMFAHMELLLLQRRFSDALSLLNQSPQDVFHYIKKPKEFFEGAIYTFLNDKEKALSAFERARTIAEKALRESPDDASRHEIVGMILAGLGEKDAAIAEGRRAVELTPESADAYDGPYLTASLAQIFAWVGEKDQAFRLLDHLLTIPNGLTVPRLKLDPAWDPLRGDPRFEKIVTSLAPEK
jgi:TolB-like protein/Tfp pilus assembly protein PilF